MQKIKSIILNKKNSAILALILLIIITALFVKFTKKVDEYTIEDHKLYQFLSGIRVDYEGKIKINKTKNKVTKINFKDIEINLDSTPIFFKDEEKALFPQTMSVIKPREGTQFKVNYYSTIYKDLDHYTIEDGKTKSIISGSIIYDGNDLYFLTENANVVFGNENIELSPMSYIIVDTFNKVVEIYDSKEDDCKVYENNEEIVKIKNEEYELNATYDTLYYNNTSIILMKNLEKLKHL